MPSSANASMLSGIRPSPHALSMGGAAQSTTVTSQASRLNAIAAARPAGPPPTMQTFRLRMDIYSSFTALLLSLFGQAECAL